MTAASELLPVPDVSALPFFSCPFSPLSFSFSFSFVSGSDGFSSVLFCSDEVADDWAFEGVDLSDVVDDGVFDEDWFDVVDGCVFDEGWFDEEEPGDDTEEVEEVVRDLFEFEVDDGGEVELNLDEDVCGFCDDVVEDAELVNELVLEEVVPSLVSLLCLILYCGTGTIR